MSRPRLQLCWLCRSSGDRGGGRLHGCWLAELSLSESELALEATEALEAPEATIDLVTEAPASRDGLGLVPVVRLPGR